MPPLTIFHLYPFAPTSRHLPSHPPFPPTRRPRARQVSESIERAYNSSLDSISRWKLDEFNSSVLTYKKCGPDAVRPIIQQLNDVSGDATRLLERL